MAGPSELDLTTPQRSQYISGIKRINLENPDSYSPSEKQLEKQPRTFSPLSKWFENVVVDKVTSDTVVQLSDVVCATFNNPNFIAIPTIAEKVSNLCNLKSNNWYKKQYIHICNHCWTNKSYLKKQLANSQDDNTKLKPKIDLIHMRFEEQEQYFRRTSLRFLNVGVPTDQKVNIIQPVDSDRIYEGVGRRGVIRDL